MRRWAATIQVSSTTARAMQAAQSDADLQADQLKAAVAQAGEMITSGTCTQAFVQLFKTTAKGTAGQRTYTVYADASGKVRYQ